MSSMTSWLDRSEAATLGLSRVSQAAVLQAADWGQRWAPSRSRHLSQVWLQWLTEYVEEPARLAARPYAVLHELLTLHREFAQRLLEIAEGPITRPTPTHERDAVVVDLASVQRRRAADR